MTCLCLRNWPLTLFSAFHYKSKNRVQNGNAFFHSGNPNGREKRDFFSELCLQTLALFRCMEKTLETGSSRNKVKASGKCLYAVLETDYTGKKRSSFVSIAKASFLWRISYATEVAPRWSCAEDMVAPLPHRVRQEKPSSPTPRLPTAHTRMNYGSRRLVTPLQLFSASCRPTQVLASPVALLSTEP